MALCYAQKREQRLEIRNAITSGHISRIKSSDGLPFRLLYRGLVARRLIPTASNVCKRLARPAGYKILTAKGVIEAELNCKKKTPVACK